ncbi:uncharacterized protein LOC143025819 [Oratosquilla oratoria]|uniref:uncharacterized protein LOC143025819 n=1 Tax=Oratosquilla oratoria TaxID=337810 RepID=UPI003F761C09
MKASLQKIFLNSLPLLMRSLAVITNPGAGSSTWEPIKIQCSPSTLEDKVSTTNADYRKALNQSSQPSYFSLDPHWTMLTSSQSQPVTRKYENQTPVSPKTNIHFMSNARPAQITINGYQPVTQAVPLFQTKMYEHTSKVTSTLLPQENHDQPTPTATLSTFHITPAVYITSTVILDSLSGVHIPKASPPLLIYAIPSSSSSSDRRNEISKSLSSQSRKAGNGISRNQKINQQKPTKVPVRQPEKDVGEWKGGRMIKQGGKGRHSMESHMTIFGGKWEGISAATGLTYSQGRGCGYE